MSEENNKYPRTKGGANWKHVLAFVIFGAAIFGGILNSCYMNGGADKQQEGIEESN